MGQKVGDAPEVFWYDAFFQRYGWDYPTIRIQPEWLLEELEQVMVGEAEGIRLARANKGAMGHTAPIDSGDGESTASYAARKGLPPPPGGWPMPVNDG